MKKKIKWLSIAIILCFIVACITSLIPDFNIRQGLSGILGLAIGVYCMQMYIDED